MTLVCPVYNLFQTVQDTPPLTKQEYLEHLPVLNTLSPFQTFLTTGLHQIKADDITSSGVNRNSNKLHVDFIPIGRLDIRAVTVAGETKYFVSFRSDKRLRNNKKWID